KAPCDEPSQEGVYRQGCALHPLLAGATATAEAGFLEDDGVSPVAGDAVNPSMEAWPRLARVRCPAHTARPGLGVLPNPPEACLGPMPQTPPQPDPLRLRQIPAVCWNGSWGQIRYPKETDLTPDVFRYLTEIHPRMAWIYRVDQGRHLPTAAGICQRRGGVGRQDRWRHGWRHRAPMDGFTACPACPHRPATPRNARCCR